MYHFFYFVLQNLRTSFSRMADHSYNIVKARRNLSKGGYRITGNGKVQRTNKGGKIVVTCFENSVIRFSISIAFITTVINWFGGHVWRFANGKET